eukprot:14018488-Alexandrium_andersonii.AAC.1
MLLLRTRTLSTTQSWTSSQLRPRWPSPGHPPRTDHGLAPATPTPRPRTDHGQAPASSPAAARTPSGHRT